MSFETPRVIREAEHIRRIYFGIESDDDGFFEHMEDIRDYDEQRSVEVAAKRKIQHIGQVLHFIRSSFYQNTPDADLTIVANVCPPTEGEFLLGINTELFANLEQMIDAQLEYSNFFYQGDFEGRNLR